MTKYRMRIQYLGTDYSGWQVQKGRLTVQGAIQDALERIAGRRVSVVGSGRTDSGVHARGQVAHFRLEEPIPPARLFNALNGILPWDIRIMRLVPVAARFHAQRDATRKRYEYKIYNGPVVSPFLKSQVLQVRAPLDFKEMREAASLLEGCHDFKGFAAASSRVRDYRRRVFVSRLAKRGRVLTYRVEGDGFLHHMVRNIVGTLIEIGRGRRPVEDMALILRSRDRRMAGPTVSPDGLCLVKVWYEGTGPAR